MIWQRPNRAFGSCRASGLVQLTDPVIQPAVLPLMQLLAAQPPVAQEAAANDDERCECVML